MLLKERSKELGGEMRDAYGAALADLLQTNDKIMILDSDPSLSGLRRRIRSISSTLVSARQICLA